MKENHVDTHFWNLKKRVTCERHTRRAMESRSMGDGSLWMLNAVVPSEAGCQGALEEASVVHARVAGTRTLHILEEPMLTGAAVVVALLTAAGHGAVVTEIETAIEIGIGTGDANEKATESEIAIGASGPRTGSAPGNKFCKTQ